MTAHRPEGDAASELKLRVTSALVLAALVLVTTIVGGWPFRLLWCAVAGLVAYEWIAMVARRHAVAGGLAVGIGGLLLGLLPITPGAVAGAGALAAFAGAVVAARSRNTMALLAAGIAYALIFALVTPILREHPTLGLALIVWTFAVVWLTDTAAYFAGRTLGGPKLMPRVSPKKTWSGAIGGTLAGTLGGFAVWSATPEAAGLGWLPALLGSAMASIASQAGDLFESAMKRRFGAKDSSRLIPGHGGFLDRLDGYWSVLVLAGLALVFLHPGS